MSISTNWWSPPFPTISSPTLIPLFYIDFAVCVVCNFLCCCFGFIKKKLTSLQSGKSSNNILPFVKLRPILAGNKINKIYKKGKDKGIVIFFKNGDNDR